jgi:predicted cupin superfamily sugar epimerase
MDARARAHIDRLGLQPHPEGGYFHQVYRSGSTVQPADDRPPRAAVTTIYFLLTSGQHSRWHRVGSDEVWHFYEGTSLELYVAPPSLDRVERVTLSGSDGPGRFVHVVPAGWWQAAQPLGEYTLVGCTVAPGFEYDDYSFLGDDAEALKNLQGLDTDLKDLI